MTRIVALGDLMTDVVAVASEPLAAGSDTRSSVRVSGGGSAANTAAWLAATGAAVSYVGRVGDDQLGRAAVADLARLGVDVRVTVDASLPTGACVVVATPDGQRSMFPDAGANAGLRADDLPGDLLGPGTHLHLSGYSLLTAGSRPAAIAALAVARAAGCTVSVDPASVGPLRAVGVDRFLGWVDGVDLLLANDDEARLLAGRASSDEAGGVLARRFGHVVVRLGPGGADWFSGAEHAHVPAVPVEVVDTTGAGDCFSAGFLPPWLAGAAPVDALTAGCTLAARVVTQVGARP